MKRKQEVISQAQEMRHEEHMLTIILKACADTKGKNIALLDVRESFGLCDYFVVVSGRSDRQVQGICNKILNSLQAYGIKADAVEGLDRGHWVLLDFGDVVVHAFYEPIREYYDIEGLWSGAKRIDLKEDYRGEFETDSL